MGHWSKRVCGKAAASLRQGSHSSMQQADFFPMGMNIHDKESAADLPQTLCHTERVCGRSAAENFFTTGYEYSCHRVCGRSAADSLS